MGQPGEHPDGLSDESAESIAARVCDALTREPYLSRLAAAIAHALSHQGTEQPSGLAPIGPYEIAPEFGDPVWMDDRQLGDSPVAQGPLTGPQVFPRRGRPEADRDL
jgi:hypothetical protein